MIGSSNSSQLLFFESLVKQIRCYDKIMAIHFELPNGQPRYIQIVIGVGSLSKHWIECVGNEVIFIVNLLPSYFQLEVGIRLHRSKTLTDYQLQQVILQTFPLGS